MALNGFGRSHKEVIKLLEKYYCWRGTLKEYIEMVCNKQGTCIEERAKILDIRFMEYQRLLSDCVITCTCSEQLLPDFVKFCNAHRSQLNAPQMNLNLKVMEKSSQRIEPCVSTPIWDFLLSIIGTDLMLHIFETLSLFIKMPKGCLLQLCGVPVQKLTQRNCQHEADYFLFQDLQKTRDIITLKRNRETYTSSNLSPMLDSLCHSKINESSTKNTRFTALKRKHKVAFSSLSSGQSNSPLHPNSSLQADNYISNLANQENPSKRQKTFHQHQILMKSQAVLAEDSSFQQQRYGIEHCSLQKKKESSQDPSHKAYNVSRTGSLENENKCVFINLKDCASKPLFWRSLVSTDVGSKATNSNSKTNENISEMRKRLHEENFPGEAEFNLSCKKQMRKSDDNENQVLSGNLKKTEIIRQQYSKAFDLNARLKAMTSMCDSSSSDLDGETIASRLMYFILTKSSQDINNVRKEFQANRSSIRSDPDKTINDSSRTERGCRSRPTLKSKKGKELKDSIIILDDSDESVFGSKKTRHGLKSKQSSLRRKYFSGGKKRQNNLEDLSADPVKLAYDCSRTKDSLTRNKKPVKKQEKEVLDLIIVDDDSDESIYDCSGSLIASQDNGDKSVYNSSRSDQSLSKQMSENEIAGKLQDPFIVLDDSDDESCDSDETKYDSRSPEHGSQNKQAPENQKEEDLENSIVILDDYDKSYDSDKTTYDSSTPDHGLKIKQLPKNQKEEDLENSLVILDDYDKSEDSGKTTYDSSTSDHGLKIKQLPENHKEEKLLDSVTDQTDFAEINDSSRTKHDLKSKQDAFVMQTDPIATTFDSSRTKHGLKSKQVSENEKERELVGPFIFQDKLEAMNCLKRNQIPEHIQEKEEDRQKSILTKTARNVPSQNQRILTATSATENRTNAVAICGASAEKRAKTISFFLSNVMYSSHISEQLKARHILNNVKDSNKGARELAVCIFFEPKPKAAKTQSFADKGKENNNRYAKYKNKVGGWLDQYTKNRDKTRGCLDKYGKDKNKARGWLNTTAVGNNDQRRGGLDKTVVDDIEQEPKEPKLPRNLQRSLTILRDFIHKFKNFELGTVLRKICPRAKATKIHKKICRKFRINRRLTSKFSNTTGFNAGQKIYYRSALLDYTPPRKVCTYRSV